MSRLFRLRDSEEQSGGEPGHNLLLSSGWSTLGGSNLRNNLAIHGSEFYAIILEPALGSNSGSSYASITSWSFFGGAIVIVEAPVFEP